MRSHVRIAAEKLHPAVTLYFGPEGEVWLDHLPQYLAEIAERWALDLHSPFENLSINYVAPGTLKDGTPVVLKLGVPSPESATEAAALRAFGGRGAVGILESEPERGALLLERIQPGQTAHDLPEDQAVRAVAEVIRSLHRDDLDVDQKLFPRLADWFEALDRYRVRFRDGTGAIPVKRIDRAIAIAAELIASTESPHLLHGDLHHDNILIDESGGWRAIDPKGIIGDPCFEIAPFLRNPSPEIERVADPQQTRTRRLDLFHELLGYDRERMRMWGEAEGVLSAVWDAR